MISKKVAIEVLNAGLATGADFAEIYVEEIEGYGLRVENAKTQSPSSSILRGAGIRLLNGYNSVYGSTNDLSRRGLLKLAETLSASFNEERKVTVEKITRVKVSKNNRAKKSGKDIPVEEKISLLKETNDIISSHSPSIVRTITSVSEERRTIQIFNSDGKEFRDFREHTRFGLLAVAANEDGIESAFEGPGLQGGYEYLEESIDIRAMAKEVAEGAINALNAKDAPSGKMPVVIGNGFGGVIFHEACGHALEATSVAKGFSVFANKIGEQIANPVVTAIDDGTIENGWGSMNVDDEGNKTRRNVLIKNGVLQSYMVDAFNGRRMNTEPTGSTRRQNYRYEPTSRMTNTFIDNGESTVEEIIASVDLGLYAKKLGGGSVVPGTGDFNFAATEAYIIRNGKIAEQVKGATLIGNGAEILKNIDMVGNDLKRGQGMCGSASGSIQADVGQPTIRVSEITVGGAGGELR